MPVTETANRETSEKLDPVTESIRPFHTGPLRRCPRCGRKVFLPCLACRTELKGDVHDPLETEEDEPLRVELQGDRRRRYEYCRLEKFARSVRREEREDDTGGR